MINDDEFLYFDVVFHGPVCNIDGAYAAIATYNRPAPPANDDVYGPEDAA